jgi:hypothetical protein
MAAERVDFMMIVAHDAPDFRTIAAQLLPAAVVDYVPADHLAQFVVALAREHLDLSEIASYKSGLGQPTSGSVIWRRWGGCFCRC